MILEDDAVLRYEQEVKSLSWTKDCDAKLETSISFLSKTYRLILFGKAVPYIDSLESLNPVHIKGKYDLNVDRGVDRGGVDLKENIMFGHNWHNITDCGSYSAIVASFYTRNHSMMIDFIKSTPFKSLSYDKKSYELLKVAHELNTEEKQEESSEETIEIVNPIPRVLPSQAQLFVDNFHKLLKEYACASIIVNNKEYDIVSISPVGHEFVLLQTAARAWTESEQILVHYANVQISFK